MNGEMIRKSQPTPGDVHVNTPLTNISIAYMQDQSGFIADRVFPNIPVGKQSDLFYQYDRGFFNRDEMKKRAPNTESAGGGYELDTGNYFADVWAFHHDIPDQRRGNSDTPLAPDREATNLVSQKAMIRREKLFVTNFFTASTWTQDFTGVSSGPTGDQFLQWNDAASTPIEDIRAGMTRMLERTGIMPNKLVLGYQVHTALLDHPDIIDRIKYGQTSGVARERAANAALAEILELGEVLVSRAIENTAAEGATNSHSFIAGKQALLTHAASSPGLMTPTGGYTFSWNGYLGAGNAGQRIKRFRMEALASDRVEIEMAFDQKLVAADLGSFFATAVA